MFQVGCQLWTAYAPCGSQHKDAVQITLEQVIQGYEDRNDQSILSYSHMIWGYEDTKDQWCDHLSKLSHCAYRQDMMEHWLVCVETAVSLSFSTIMDGYDDMVHISIFGHIRKYIRMYVDKKLFQIDLIKRLADQYSSHLQLAQTAQGNTTKLFSTKKCCRFWL